jgi:cytochrome P450
MSLYTIFDHYKPPIGPDGTPYDYFEALRDEAIETETPIGWSESYGGFWVCTGWLESREIQRNPEKFSSATVTFPSYATPNERPLMFAGQDGEEHMKYRRFVQSQFSPGKAKALGEQMRAVVNELIDGFIGAGRVDIADVFTAEVPARLAALMGGLPVEDAHLYRKWTHAVSQIGVHDPEAVKGEFEELDAYVAERSAEWRSRTGDDYITMVGREELDGAPVDAEDFRDLFLSLIMGAVDNTFYMLSTIFWRLGWDKELRRRLVRRPELIPLSVDEFLRMYSPAYSGRLVKERMEIGGITLEPGQQIVLAHAIENRDPREFPNPDVFIADRSPNRHFALGLGVHRCLGMHILRVEAQVTVEEFVKRIPEWELDPEGAPKWYAGQVGGMMEVPIVFPPGGGHPEADWSPGRPLAAA